MAIKTETFTGGGGAGAVTSVNGQTGVVVVSGDDIAADHTASNYTAANANVDGHLSGIDTKLGTLAAGLTYKGAFNATAGTPSIANALQGDLYVVDTAGTIYGQTWAIGDHLLINADMGGSVTNSKIDKIDNTDQVTSVNGSTGAVTLSGDDLAADHTASNYTAANANIDGHLSGIDSKFGTLATVATTGAYSDLSGTPTLATVATTGAYSDLSGKPTLGTASAAATTDFLASTAGLDDLSDVSFTAGAGIDNYVLTYDHSTTSWGAEAAASGGLSEVVQDTTPQLGGDLDVNGNSITSAGNGNVVINPAGTGEIGIGADLVPDTDVTHTIGAEASRYITYYGDMNGAIRFKAKNDEGSAITKGQVLYIKGISGSVPTVGLADANDSSKMQAFGLAAANANDQAEVQVVTFGNLTDFDTSSFSAGDTVFVSTTAGALTATAPTGETSLIQNIGFVLRSDASAGIIKVGGAGRTNATPNLDQNKIFLGNASNQAVSTALSSVNLSSFNNDLSFLSNIVEDTTPELGGNLDVGTSDIVSSSNNNIEFAANGTGVVKVIPTATGGHLELNGDGTNVGKLRLMCEQSSHGIYLTGPSHSASASYTLKFPDTAGTNNYVLKTDGSGNLDWVAQSGGAAGWTYSAITADPANAQANYHYSCTGTFTITLPTSGVSSGEEIRVKNMGTGTITIDPQTQNIDGATTDYVLDAQYQAITLVSTGSHWEVI